MGEIVKLRRVEGKFAWRLRRAHEVVGEVEESLGLPGAKGSGAWLLIRTATTYIVRACGIEHAARQLEALASELRNEPPAKG